MSLVCVLEPTRCVGDPLKDFDQGRDVSNGSIASALPVTFAGQVLVCQESTERSLLPCHDHKKKLETSESTYAQNAMLMLMNNFV